MEYCSKCGKKLIDDSDTCTVCGYKAEGSNFNVAQRRNSEKIVPASGDAVLGQVSAKQYPQPQPKNSEPSKSSSAAAAPQTESSNTEPHRKDKTRDNISAQLCALSAFIPPFGVIYWLLRKKASPLRAYACGLASICGAVYIAIFFFIIMGFLHN